MPNKTDHDTRKMPNKTDHEQIKHDFFFTLVVFLAILYKPQILYASGTVPLAVLEFIVAVQVNISKFEHKAKPIRAITATMNSRVHSLTFGQAL